MTYGRTSNAHTHIHTNTRVQIWQSQIVSAIDLFMNGCLSSLTHSALVSVVVFFFFFLDNVAVVKRFVNIYICKMKKICFNRWTKQKKKLTKHWSCTWYGWQRCSLKNLSARNIHLSVVSFPIFFLFCIENQTVVFTDCVRNFFFPSISKLLYEWREHFRITASAMCHKQVNFRKNLDFGFLSAQHT